MQFINHFMCSENLVKRTQKQFDSWKNLIVENPKVIFDVGANIGVYSCFFSKFFPESKIYAFEPVLENYNNLLENLKLNNVENVTAFNFGFLGKRKTEKMGIPQKRDSSNTGLYSVFHKDFQKSVTCQFENFDEWCEQNNVFPNLIKLDTEGTEYEILSNMKSFDKISYLITENNYKNYPDNALNVEFLLQKNFTILEKGDDFVWGKHTFNPIYNTEFDKCGREYVKETIENLCKDKNSINILVIGSPDVKEFDLISVELKAKINLFVFDMEDKKDNDINKQFKNYYFKKINVFNYPFSGFENQMDIVFHRWFLHHCNTKQKEESINICKKVLKSDGKLIIIDWFVPDFNSKDEFKDSLMKYYKYQMKYNIAPNPNKWMQNFKDLEAPNGHGGKFTSINKLKKILEENQLKYSQEFLCPSHIDDPELFGQSVFLCEKF